MKPSRTLLLERWIDQVTPLRDGRLFVRTSDGAAFVVRDDDVRELAATPLRWPGRPERASSGAWEIAGDAVWCPPGQPPFGHVHGMEAEGDARLFSARAESPTEGIPDLASAVRGRDGEVLCTGDGAVFAFAFLAGRVVARAAVDGVVRGPLRFGERIVVWSQHEVLVLDLALMETARRSFDFVHDVAVVGDVAVIMLSREAVLVDADLEEYGRVAYRGAPGKTAIDVGRGFLYVAIDVGGSHVTLLDVREGRVRWVARGAGGSSGQPVIAGDLLVHFGRASLARDDEAPETTGDVLNAVHGGHVSTLFAPFPVERSVALAGGRVACLWRREPAAIAGGTSAGVFMDPRQEGDPILLEAGSVRGLCADARGALVTWGSDGVLARWEL